MHTCFSTSHITQDRKPPDMSLDSSMTTNLNTMPGREWVMCYYDKWIELKWIQTGIGGNLEQGANECGTTRTFT